MPRQKARWSWKTLEPSWPDDWRAWAKIKEVKSRITPELKILGRVGEPNTFPRIWSFLSMVPNFDFSWFSLSSYFSHLPKQIIYPKSLIIQEFNQGQWPFVLSIMLLSFLPLATIFRSFRNSLLRISKLSISIRAGNVTQSPQCSTPHEKLRKGNQEISASGQVTALLFISSKYLSRTCPHCNFSPPLTLVLFILFVQRPDTWK